MLLTFYKMHNCTKYVYKISHLHYYSYYSMSVNVKDTFVLNEWMNGHQYDSNYLYSDMFDCSTMSEWQVFWILIHSVVEYTFVLNNVLNMLSISLIFSQVSHRFLLASVYDFNDFNLRWSGLRLYVLNKKGLSHLCHAELFIVQFLNKQINQCLCTKNRN